MDLADQFGTAELHAPELGPQPFVRHLFHHCRDQPHSQTRDATRVVPLSPVLGVSPPHEQGWPARVQHWYRPDQLVAVAHGTESVVVGDDGRRELHP